MATTYESPSNEELNQMNDAGLKEAYSKMGSQPFIDPKTMNWFRSNRPDIIRNDILLHQQMGGYMSPVAKRFLRRGR